MFRFVLFLVISLTRLAVAIGVAVVQLAVLVARGLWKLAAFAIRFAKERSQRQRADRPVIPERPMMPTDRATDRTVGPSASRTSPLRREPPKSHW
jgi:hypothetical protein